MTDELDKVLRFDALDTAEKLTGKSCKEDEDTELFGMAMFLENNNNKDKLLQQNDDTTFSNSVENYVRIIEDMGFEKGLVLDFKNPRGGNRQEKMFVYGHREKGIILKFDTYNEGRVNAGKYYYCWRPYDLEEFREARVGATSSGGWDGFKEDDDNYEEVYWCGDHDCREAVRHNIGKLAQWGDFLPVWPKCPFMWLLHYGDTAVHGYNHKKITEERIAVLPAWMRAIIGC